METIGCHNNQSYYLISDQNKNTIYVEANALSMYAKFHLHPLYGLRGDSICNEIVPINQKVLYSYALLLHFQKDLLLCYTTAKSQLSSSFPTLHNLLLGFYNMLAWWPSWSCDLDHLYNFVSPFTRRLQMKFGFNRPNGLKVFENGSTG